MEDDGTAPAIGAYERRCPTIGCSADVSEPRQRCSVAGRPVPSRVGPAGLRSARRDVRVACARPSCRSSTRSRHRRRRCSGRSRRPGRARRTGRCRAGTRPSVIGGRRGSRRHSLARRTSLLGEPTSRTGVATGAAGTDGAQQREARRAGTSPSNAIPEAVSVPVVGTRGLPVHEVGGPVHRHAGAHEADRRRAVARSSTRWVDAPGSVVVVVCRAFVLVVVAVGSGGGGRRAPRRVDA